MSNAFTRTPTGMAAKWQFHSVPTIWVEGPTDVSFYCPIVSDLECRIEPFHGKPNAEALIEGLVENDYPYLVVLDGDYEILQRPRRIHKHVVRLKRYSVENYLWESESVNQTCLRYAQRGDQRDVVGPEMNRLNQHLTETLLEMVVIDVAARRLDPAPPVLPNRVERLLVSDRKPDICPVKVGRITSDALLAIDTKTLESARNDVSSFLKRRQLTDLLKGHVVFGVLRLVFTQTTSAIKGSKVIVNDDALTQMLVDAMWNCLPSKDHIALRTEIRKNVKKLIPLCAVAAQAFPNEHDTH